MNQIKSGGYREVFHDNNFVYKRLLDYRTKNYFGFDVNFPMSIYCFLKFGIKDFNEEEIKNFNLIKNLRIPNFLDYFSQIHGFVEIDGFTYLKSDLVKDFDGKKSQTLKQKTPSSGLFWEKLEFVLDSLVVNDVFLFDLNSNNIFVKRINERDEIPVFFDYKRVGRKTYLAQPNLFLRSQRVKKTNRHLDYLVANYK